MSGKGFVIIGSFIGVSASAQHGTLEFHKNNLEMKRIYQYLG
jgi:hypothetical protein